MVLPAFLKHVNTSYMSIICYYRRASGTLHLHTRAVAGLHNVSENGIIPSVNEYTTNPMLQFTLNYANP